MDQHQQDDSQLLFKGPCEACGSSDACASYSDGHTHCFSCGAHTGSTGDAPARTSSSSAASSDFTPIMGDIGPLRARGITEETCAHFGYAVGKDPKTGKLVQLAPYRDADGRIVAQKWRDKDKNFGLIGKLKSALPLFGQHLWRDGGKKVVITEGEIDCMSVSQVQGNKWPVVSVPNGAQGAKKALQAALEWLERFDEVILMFDMDDPGRDAVAECSPLFTPGRCKVASLPLKDPNELLKAGRGAEIIEAIWGAKPYRPDGVVSILDVVDAASEDIADGIPWLFETMTEMTYGRRPGELHVFGAGTGIGKTDLFTQSIAYDLLKLKLTVGVIYLEQPTVETARRIAGKAVGKHLHLPRRATKEERKAALDIISEGNRLHFYDSFGKKDWETVKAKIRYQAVSLGCKVIYLDHLTALVAAEEDERRALDLIMEEVASLALELGVVIHAISHLARPKDGATHEEGGRVKQAQFRGSNAIGMWAHYMWGLERNTQAEDGGDQSRTTLRCLKDRPTGQATGKTIPLTYDPETGLLAEGSVADSPFTDRTTSGTDPF
jgi:twinkle protein